MKKPFTPVLDLSQLGKYGINYSDNERFQMVIKTLNKYRNIRTANNDGTMSDSRKEARIDAQYQVLLRCGQLTKVERKKRFPIIIGGIKICDYECDWCITDTAGNSTVIDAKGLKTPVYRLKKKLMKALHGIDIIER